MRSVLASRRKSPKTETFKNVQMDLFDFLNLKGLGRLKGLDLKGPLKYLQNKPAKKSLSPSNPSDSDLKILGYPAVIHRKPYLRYIRFYVKPNGVLNITAPKNRSLDLIVQEVSEYKDWIDKCEQEHQAIRDQFPLCYWVSGQRFFFQGQSLELRLQAYELKKPLLQIDLDQLHYFYPATWEHLNPNEKAQNLKKHLLKFYKTKATAEIDQRTRYWSEQMQLFPKQVTYRNQKTRWGSCSSEGKISFNWRLIAYDPEIMDYIVVHELAHLKHQNHGKRFWALVERFCPKYQSLRVQLRNEQYAADFLSPISELYLENPQLPLNSNTARTTWPQTTTQNL